MLPSGTRLGPYEVLGLIGEGGMGQVYRAADTRLDRAVAIKVMPAALADDPVRRERFEREARSISRLEHPNICPLYDVGELPAEVGGGLFLVMQFLEGETLAQRLSRGPLSIKETLDVGIQIAEALAAAHRAGIVHRDLKPGNVMLTRAGARLLDFGLARTVADARPAARRPRRRGDRTALTTQGTLLGTLHYMAPEQLDGREVDTRADIFAFGAVLYEMVTGLKAFEAETPARVLSAILRDEPARVSTIVPVTPSGLDELIHTCLAKDPNERWQGMGDVARQLRWLQSGLSSAQVRTDRPRRCAAGPRARWRSSVEASRGRGRRRGGRRGGDAGWCRAPRRLRFGVHAFLLPPENNYLTGGLALSPDGRARSPLSPPTPTASGRSGFARSIPSRAQPLEGTSGASDPFWSPSGSELAFFANDQLKRIAIGGGPATVICEAGIGAGGSWSADGTIVFQPHQQGALMQVPASGGRPEPATTLDADDAETHHLYPSFLPDGRHFVFYVAGKQRGLYVGEIGSSERSFLFDPDPSLPAGAAATPGVYSPSRASALRARSRADGAAVRCGVAHRCTGEPFKLADAVDYNPPGQAAFAIAGSVLVYRPRQHLALGSLMWMDRSGEGAVGDRRVRRGVPAAVAVTRRPHRRGRAARRAGPVVGVDDRSRSPEPRCACRANTGAASPVWSGDGSVLAYSIATDSPPNIVVRARSRHGRRTAHHEVGRRFTIPARSRPMRGRCCFARSRTTPAGISSRWRSTAARRSALLQTPANENEMSLSPRRTVAGLHLE